MVNFLWIAGLKAQFLEVLNPAVLEHEVYYPVLERIYEPYPAIHEIRHRNSFDVPSIGNLVDLALCCRAPLEERLVVLPLLVNDVFQNYFLGVGVYYLCRKLERISLERG